MPATRQNLLFSATFPDEIRKLADDLPHVTEDYVHRIGHTGCARAEGEAVSLVTEDDRPLMAAIERVMNRKVEERGVAGFGPGSRGQGANSPRPQ